MGALGVIIAVCTGLAAFLFELIIARKLVVPKDTGDSSLSGMVYDFLHGEEAM